MQYPQDFPPESRSRVEAERLRAGKDFDQARQNAPHREYDARPYLEAELRRYILRPFAVFVSELCKRGCQGIVQVDEIDKAAWEFVRRFTIHATYSKGFDKFGRKFAQNWIEHWGHLQPSLMREFERSDQWRQFQEELLHVAECRAMRASDAGETVREEIGDVALDSTQSERTSAWSEVEEVAVAAPEPVLTAANDPDRHSMVHAFLLACNKELPAGSKVVKKHIWLAAGHTDRRQFQYWQSGSDKATEEDDRNFRRILSMPPAEFLALLQKKGISVSKS